jgi:hypothetical protein
MNFIPLAESSGRIEAVICQMVGRALSGLQPHLKATGFQALVQRRAQAHPGAGFVETLAVAATRGSRNGSRSR